MIRRFPSVYILVFIVSGIALADISQIPSGAFLLLCLILCLTGFVALNNSRKWLATVLFGLSLCAFSGFHFAIRYYDVGPNHVAKLADSNHQYHIFGKVVDWPDLKVNRTEVKIAIDSVSDAGLRRVSGSILLRISDTTTALQRGDRVEFYGRVYAVKSKAAASFDYGRHLNMKGVFGIAYLPTLLDVRIDRRNRYGFLSYIDDLRDTIRRVLYSNLSPSSAALACGFLIGETRDIPADVYRQFRDSGTLHLLAVSGSNVALVLLFFIFILRPLAMTPVRRAVILLAIIVAFTLLSYGEPSVVRASIMAALIIIAGILQRRHDLNNVIAVAAVIILLGDPAQLYDIGFQLSFVIAWGLIFILPRVAEFFRPVHNRRWYRWLVFPFLVSAVAQVCSVGLISFYFDRVPLISPLANLLVVPLVSAAVVGVLLVLLAHLILPLLGAFAGAWLDMLLQFILTLVRLLGSESMPSLTIAELPVWLAGLFYLFIFLLAWSLQNKSLRQLVVLGLIVFLNAALLTSVLPRSGTTGTTEITLFEIPGGIGAVVQRRECSSADLVITGMRTRDYSICDRIIEPQLSRLGVKRISRIFVLSAEYDAVRDIVRMAQSDSVLTIYVKPSLRPSFLDALAIEPSFARKCQPIPLGNTVEPVDSLRSSYFYSEQALVLSTNDSRVVFCDRIAVGRHQRIGNIQNETIVIGQQRDLSEHDLRQITAAGFTRVICSNNAHRNFQQLGLEIGSGAVAGPMYMEDISDLGVIKLNL